MHVHQVAAECVARHVILCRGFSDFSIGVCQDVGVKLLGSHTQGVIQTVECDGRRFALKLLTGYERDGQLIFLHDIQRRELEHLRGCHSEFHVECDGFVTVHKVKHLRQLSVGFYIAEITCFLAGMNINVSGCACLFVSSMPVDSDIPGTSLCAEGLRGALLIHPEGILARVAGGGVRHPVGCLDIPCLIAGEQSLKCGFVFQTEGSR